jgi:hypothetical protein
MSSITQARGECVHCKVVWHWVGLPRLKTACCQVCATPLQRMTRRTKSAHKEGRPALRAVPTLRLRPLKLDLPSGWHDNTPDRGPQ